MKFEGVIPPVTTPFGADGEILFSSLEANLNSYLETKLSGFLLLGSNGEAVHLSESEKEEIIRCAAALLRGSGRYLIAGLSSATLTANLAFLDRVSDLEIDALLVSVPSYYRNRMGKPAIKRYFLEVAERSPFPVLLYNVPQYSGLAIPPDLIGELADHDRIVGMKDSAGNFGYLETVLEQTAEKDFEVLLGSAGIWGPALALGIKAAILAVACAFPNLPMKVMKTQSAGGDIGRLQLELFRVSQALTSGYGVPGLKHAMDLAGLDGRHCRAPLYDLTEEEKAAVSSAIASQLETASINP